MPATKYAVLTLSVTAAALVLGNRAIDQDGGYSTAAGNSFGASTEDAPAIGAQVGVDMLGTTIVEAGAAVAKDALLQVGVDGKYITKAAGVTVGRAMQAAGADGDKIEALLIPN